jgi:hypothetical protein
MTSQERRSVQRIRLSKALRGSVGTMRMFAIDISIKGVRLAHQEPMGRPGERCAVTVEWEGAKILLQCVIRHTRIERRATASNPKALHYSGLEIQEASETALEMLRHLVAVQIERALDEQKANARGIPAIAADSFQTGKGDRYVRHELADGVWKSFATLESRQPPTGFTISAEIEPSEVEMLREAYEKGDPAARALIRQMSALSISKNEGIPTRRYEP